MGGLRVTLTGGSGETAIEVAEGQSILDAALRSGTWIPHSCTQGTCGTCKLRILSGDVDHQQSPEFTLTSEERDRRIALGCMATPRSDLVVESLERTDDDAGVHHPLRDHEGTVVVLDDVAVGTRRLVVDLDAPMHFHAGQYAELIVPGLDVARQYSMANPPEETSRLEFHVKLTHGGISTDNWIFSSMRVGDRISLRGPLGRFSLADRHEEPAVLIGGGTGLAPLKSMIRHALTHGLLPEMHLYHGVRRHADLYDVDCFRELDADHPTFHYRPVLSDEQWSGSMGMVTDAVLSDFRSCKGMRAYLCGPPPMVEAAVKALKRRRMAPRLIFREEFTPSPVPVAAANRPGESGDLPV